ncbi:hypothetical protein DY000_02015397 [Brassica cretica]|uniref:NPH3 domain-containing protein n=1 Tax=Brassica cretica TaxID=69181 RepID=A0ABQ7D0R3_BRACR|nr:hypothetical protein DY000_02015397 [Brassica cretica]
MHRWALQCPHIVSYMAQVMKFINICFFLNATSARVLGLSSSLRFTEQRNGEPCFKNCFTDCARAVLAGGAAAKSEALKEEVLATGLLEDNPVAECNQKHNNDSSYGTYGIMVTLRIESLFDGLLHSKENWRATVCLMDSCIPRKTGELQAHQKIDKTKRKRLCRILDCKKLSVDASKNAAQSQLLALRVMVHILFDGASTSCDIYNNKHYYYKRNSSFEKKLYKKKKM